jgi:hypothetical protein
MKKFDMYFAKHDLCELEIYKIKILLYGRKVGTGILGNAAE